MSRVDSIDARDHPDDAAAGAETLSVEWLAEVPRIMALQSEWGGLFARSGSRNVFLTWEYQATWYELYGHLGDILCAAVRDGQGVLVGVAPLLRGCARAGPFSRSAVAFAGSDERSPRGCYPEFITPPRHAPQVHQAVLGDLAAQVVGPVSFVRLRQIALDTPANRALLGAASSEGYRCLLRPALRAVRGYAGQTYEQFATQVPSRGRRKFLLSFERELRRKYSSVEFRLCQDAADVPIYVQQVIDLGIRRLATRNTRSEFASPEAQQFLHLLARRLWERGGLRLVSLHLDGELAAAYFGYREGDWFHLMHHGMNPDFEKASPAHAVRAFAIRAAMEEGARYLDWLPGEHQHKRHYMAAEEQLVTVTLVHNWRGALNAALGLLLRP